MLFERCLTDASGGNISARVGDKICLTPRFAGSKQQWRLRPEQVLVVDMQGNLLDGEGGLSRESSVHLKLLNEFPEGTAVIHAHPKNVLVFVAACQPIVPVLESSLKFGTVTVAKFAPAHSKFLAEHIAAEMRGKEAALRKQAACVIAPWHGIFVLGKDLDAALDAVERIDVNAYIILNSRSLPVPADLDSLRKELSEAVQRFKE
jgi:L-fuculose-phosphate aldolase